MIASFKFIYRYVPRVRRSAIRSCRFVTTDLDGSTIKLWHSPDARSLRCLWLLEEMNVKSYQLLTMPFPPRISHKDFLKTNVLGTIPYFTDGEFSMTESSAICQYLVAKYPGTSLAIEPASKDFPAYLNWLHHADATLTFPQTIVLRYTQLEKGKCEQAAVDYAKWYLARLRLLDNTLADGRQFLVADRFTIADICMTYALFVAKAFELRLDGRLITELYKPQTMDYMNRMLSRPAFTRCERIQRESLDDFKRKHSAKTSVDGRDNNQ